MPAFRLFDPFQTFFDLTGKLAAGGSLKFYQAGTTTPANVYGEEALSTNNGPVIAIGTDGRPVDDIWGNISYRARLYDVLGNLVSDRDNLQIPGGTGLAIPALEAGKVLSNDGSVLDWLALLMLPDPTGSSGKILGTDGVNFIFQSAPVAPPALGSTVTAHSLQVGSPVSGSLNALIQWGTATAPASGTPTTSSTVTFPIPFGTCGHASAQPVTGSNPGGPMVSYPSASASGTSVNFVFDVAEGNPTAANVVNPVPFTWIAVGTVTIP